MLQIVNRAGAFLRCYERTQAVGEGQPFFRRCAVYCLIQESCKKSIAATDRVFYAHLKTFVCIHLTIKQQQGTLPAGSRKGIGFLSVYRPIQGWSSEAVH